MGRLIQQAVQLTLKQHAHSNSCRKSLQASDMDQPSSLDMATDTIRLAAEQQAQLEVQRQAARAERQQQIKADWPEKFPCLRIAEKYILREHQARDLEQFFDYYTDPLVNAYILVTRSRHLLETARDVHYNRGLYYKRDGFFWSLQCQQTGALMGTLGLYTYHNPVEICYDLAPQYWRRGIMSQTLHAVLQFVRQRWSFLSTVHAIILRENTASHVLLTKLGFRWQETRVNDRQFNGKWYDVEVYALDLSTFSADTLVTAGDYD